MHNQLCLAPAAELLEVLLFIDKAVAGALMLTAHGIPFVLYVIACTLVPGLIGIRGCTALRRIGVRTLLGTRGVVVFIVEFLFLFELVPLDAGQLALFVALALVSLILLAGFLAGGF